MGDYGTSLQNYKVCIFSVGKQNGSMVLRLRYYRFYLQEEYYFNGDIALPVRWCAPETLKCTETTIEPQQVVFVELLISSSFE